MKSADQQIPGSEVTSEYPSASQESHLFPIIVLLGLTLIMFADVLFGSKNLVLSRYGTDLSTLFIYWREFGFNQLKHGHLALWNPHIFSGMPYFGEFQSALLYPVNMVYLIFSQPTSINLDITIHTFLAGYFTFLWNNHRKFHRFSSLLAAILFMFSSAFFLHIFPGHLNRLASMAWAPLLFLSVDGFIESKTWVWCFLGIFAVAMQILAGDPQYVFYTGIALAIYFILLVSKINRKLLLFQGFCLIYLGGMALTAVQLLSGLDVAGESVRNGGVSYEFASRFSFPPENFITLLAPGFFGNNLTSDYWGRWYPWEMTLFIGVTGLILAIYGAIYSTRQSRRFSITMVGILLVLALGEYTPIYKILFYYLPGYNIFRGSSKFIFIATLFLTNLSASGLNQLFQTKQVEKKMIIGIILLAVIIGLSGLFLRVAVMNPEINFWPKMMQIISASKESYLDSIAYTNINFLNKTEIKSSDCLLLSAGLCLVIVGLFYYVRHSFKTIYLIFLLAVLEIFLFARGVLPSFNYEFSELQPIKSFLSAHLGDYRILYQAEPNSAIYTGGQDIWGYDPTVSRRYAEFMAYTQGKNPNDATNYLTFSSIPWLYKMLRIQYVFSMDSGLLQVQEVKDVMPRCILIRKYQILPNRDRIFAAMDKPEFDPQKEVILERSPSILPVGSNDNGTIKIIDTTTDSLSVEVDLSSPAILLITDSYSKGWRASPFSDSVQKKYDLMSANYILRAIPLSRGHHHIRIEYSPLSFHVGKWISIISLLTYFSLLGWYFKRSN